MKFLVSHWLHFNSASTWALRHCSLCPSLLGLFIPLSRLLHAKEISQTLLCWVGPRWEIKHPYKLKGLTKNNLVDLRGLSVFPVHQVKPFSHLPSAPQFFPHRKVFPCIPPFRLSFPAHNLHCACPSSYWVISKPAWYRNIKFILQTLRDRKKIQMDQLTVIKLQWNRFSSRYGKILLAYLPWNPLW